MLAAVFKAVYTKVNLDPKLIGDISVGNVLPAGGGATVARMAQLYAGIPHSTPINTVNRQCSSGLTAVHHIANSIKSGDIDIGIGAYGVFTACPQSSWHSRCLSLLLGAGVESMTMGYGPSAQPSSISEEIQANQESADCLIPMGITSENVAAEFKISRDEQDTFAADSFGKAAKAQKAGKFKSEIIPVKTKIVDPKTEKEVEIVVDSDDGVRAGVTKESLSKLKPAFSKTGSTHAGNASQVSDGAAAVLLARRSVAKRLGLPILGKFVAAAVVGVPPRIMGIGPAVAIPTVLAKIGLSKDEVDFYEINEAFASQAVMSVKTIGIPFEKVNIKYVSLGIHLPSGLLTLHFSGGAIAIGHPLGATGARQIATGYALARQTGGKVFVTSMCIGSGMGMAAVFTSEQ